jgi:hypothetical protein
MRQHIRSRRPGAWLRRLAAGGAIAVLIAGGLVAPVAAQPVPPDVRTIVVTGTGAATAPAETARIQFSIAAYADYGMGGMAPVPMEEPPAADAMMEGTPEVVTSEPAVPPALAPMPAMELTDEDLAPVIDAIVAAGAPADAVTVQTGPAVGGYYGPGAPGYALIEFLLPAPTLEQVNAIVAAGNRAGTGMLAVQQVGVEYNVADCTPLLEAARQAAFDDARARAEALAPHMAATVGAPVQVSDFGSTQAPVGGGTGCPPTPDTGLGIYGPTPVFNTPPFNGLAPAEARVLVQLTVTYEFELASQ